MQLRPYQIDGVEWLKSKRTALLADGMRLGKSAQAICATKACWPGKQHEMSVGVICPASVVPVWHEQFGKWWSGTLPQLHVMSYDKTTRGGFDGMNFDVLIIDEAHYLKSKDALRTKKIYGQKCDGVGGVTSRAGKVIALTGTPTPNHPAELWPMLRALYPEGIAGKNGPMTYWQFISRYCKTVDNGFGLQITGGKNHEELRQRIAPFVLRRTFKEVFPSKPDPQFDTLPVVGVAPDESELAKVIKNGMTDEEIIAALKKATDHVAALRRITGLAKVKGVVDWYRNWNESDGGKIVFMAHHRDVIHELEIGIGGVIGDRNIAKINGNSLMHERAMAAKNFRDKDNYKVFIGQIQAAGTGIDLSVADTLVFVESDWVPGNNAQAAARIESAAKTSLVQIWAATLPGSLDETIQKINLRKVMDSFKLFG